MRFWIRLLKSEDGPTSVEYAVMLALILGMIIASITVAGGSVSEYWGDSATSYGDAMSDSGVSQ